jgi:peptidoglycan/xylan/chitin deacetylase (PgdA/CDA1 family)
MQWQVDAEKTIFLTFDDGPIPDVSAFVLEQLAKYNAKATFFCVGDNIRKYPFVFSEIIADGHLVANHTYNHMQGLYTDNLTYFDNIEQCERLIEQALNAGHYRRKHRLFRPPHGLLKPSQVKYLKERYKIIMWDVLTGDFDKSLTPEKCLRATLKNTEAGSIVTFHDSIKAAKNMMYTLPRFLEHFSEKGYVFEALEDVYFKSFSDETVIPHSAHQI